MFDPGPEEPTPQDNPQDPADSPASPYAEYRTDDLADTLSQLGALERAIRAQQLALIAELDWRDAWKADGQTAMAPWLTLLLATTQATARDLARVARALVDLPAIAAVFAEGALSWEQLVPLCRLATPDTDTVWAADGPGHTPAELVILARHAKPPTPADETTARDARGLTCRPDRRITGLDVLTLRLPEAEMAAVVDVVNDLADRDFRAAQHTGDTHTTTFAQRRADAIVTPAGAAVADDAEDAAATLVVHAELTALTHHPELLGITAADQLVTELATLADGRPLCRDTARRLACDCHLVWAVTRDGNDVGISRQSRHIPRWLRRRLRQRDGGHCRFPGCDRTLGLHGHHITHWGDLGPTDTPNLVLLCPDHHHHVHEGHWTINGDADHELTFTNPTRTLTLTSRPTPLHPHTKRKAQQHQLLPPPP